MSAWELKRFALFAGLGEAEREAVAEEIESFEAEAGTQLFDEGEPGDGVLLVAAGRVLVESERTGARGEVGPGDALGALSLVASGPREARAITASRATLLRLRRSAFRRFADAEPRAACRLLEAVLRETAQAGRQALDGLPPAGQKASEATDSAVDPTARGN